MTDRGHFRAGDTLVGIGRVLLYGRYLPVGRFVCTSTTVGMRCKNRDTGHGFLISRDQAETF